MTQRTCKTKNFDNNQVDWSFYFYLIFSDETPWYQESMFQKTNKETNEQKLVRRFLFNKKKLVENPLP